MTEVLPEDNERLDAFRRALKGREQQVIDAVEHSRQTLATDGLLLLDNPGVPLRPLFLSRKRLDFICQMLHRNMKALGAAIADQLDVPETTEDLFPFPRDFLSAVDSQAVLRSQGFGLIMRPDGFLFDDRFAVSEPNHANGYLISATYPEAVYSVFEASPALAQFEIKAHVVRPLARILAMLKRQLPVPHPKGRPRIALFWHSEEHAIIKDWNARTQGILAWLPKALEKDGWDVVFAHEDELDVDRKGRCIHEKRRVDLVLQIPIGTHFLYTPERFDKELAHLRGDHIGDAPFLQPLVNLAIDKGSMPLWQTLPCWPAKQRGFRVEPIPTHFPSAERASEYRLERDAWVLKRSFEGKDTHAGISANSRVWNRALETAMATREYVMQPYVRMSTALMPVIYDGRIEWVDSSVELSLFVIDGEYSGAFARFLPTGEGHVMSPPPPGMGFTLVYDC